MVDGFCGWGRGGMPKKKRGVKKYIKGGHLRTGRINYWRADYSGKPSLKLFEALFLLQTRRPMLIKT